VSVQIFAEAELDIEVPRQFFTPPPKVDSQVVVLRTRNNPLITPEDQRDFFRIVKAGFSAKRKKLRSSLSGGLSVSKASAEQLLKKADISPDVRAEDLSIDDWRRLLKEWRAR
jgi:ribosomal RNA small subunit methyltransferase A